MKKINYKLIVSDFDGTLLTRNQTVPPDVRAAINEYVSAGGIFAVCTGRMLRSILPRVRELGLKGLVAAYQGSIIADIESGEIIRNNGLSAAEALEVCLKLESLSTPVNAYSDENLYTDIPITDVRIGYYEGITGVKSEHVVGKMSDFIRRRGGVYNKFTSLVEPENCIPLYNRLKKDLGEKYDITRSAGTLCEVSPLGDNKGEAVKFIANKFGVPLSETVAVGDNLNDLPMINAAGVGVAVGNAIAELKDAADFVAPTNDAGAIRAVIEKYGFYDD